MFEVDGACVSICARVTLFVNDAYVFACEAADSSDLGRLLSCWKHTAAHQIFTAPSNSRLHVGSLRLAWGLLVRRLSEKGGKHIGTGVQKAFQTAEKVKRIMAEALKQTVLIKYGLISNKDMRFIVKMETTDDFCPENRPPNKMCSLINYHELLLF